MMNQIKKISLKSFIILLSFSILVCGCTPNKKGKDVKKDEESSIEEKEDDISFTGLDDPKLQEYIVENLYSGFNANLNNEDFEITEISTIYISKEYLDELEYNSKNNIYFGFTDSELNEMFGNQKYVFTVKDGKTVAVKYEEYIDNNKKMLTNLAIGSGVIIVCATISVSTGGTISVVFAASVKTASKFALGSAAFSGITASVIEYYKTGDFNKAIEKGSIEATEGFKWGAIFGAVTGGTTEYIKQTKAAKNLKIYNINERGRVSEERALKKYGGREQVAYLNGKEVSASTAGATKPDIVRNFKGNLEGIEVKNYDLTSKENRKNLIREIKREVTARVKNMPEGSTQRIVLDVQGRNYDKKLLDGVVKGIKNSCSDVYSDIPVDIMY